MSTVLHRFDSPGAFPVLTTFTTARNPVSSQVCGQGVDAGLNIGCERHADDPSDVDIVLGLPLTAIDGEPHSLKLDFAGDLTGCRVSLEGMDSRGAGLTYALSREGKPGRRVLSAMIQHPTDSCGDMLEGDSFRVLLPLQLHRLRITVGPDAPGLDLRLLRLSVTGDVRLCPPGIADRPDGTQNV